MFIAQLAQTIISDLIVIAIINIPNNSENFFHLQAWRCKKISLTKQPAFPNENS